MTAAIFSAFAAALLAPWLHSLFPRRSGWLLALLPLGQFAYFASRAAAVADGRAIAVSYSWLPALGADLCFRLDGLSLLFSFLITGIGTLIIIYSGGYLAGHRHLGRFFSFIFMFEASMLGAVLADNLITLFVFWELTSLSSYFLIGFESERESSRKAALQALLVTGSGGLALLPGMLLLGQAAGSFDIPAIQAMGETVRNSWSYLPVLLLVLVGAFTKSAQFPFHFWLPSAMAAPAPVSAYLHSATMVNLGIYLLARLTPVLGGTDAWHHLVSVTGGVTMLAGALLALLQKDLKLILAYSTVSALGTLTLLLGLNTTLAAKAAMVFLLVHALYKAALFLVAGAVDHETGIRNVDRLGGLFRSMPLIGIAAVLSALSMAGMPPMFGFIAKELLYEAKLQAPSAATLITASGVTANMFIVAVAAIVGIGPFFGRSKIQRHHEEPVGAELWLGPVLFSALGLLIGLAPDLIGRGLISPAVGALRAHPTRIELALWHGVNPVFLLGVFTILCGGAIFTLRNSLYRIASRWKRIGGWGPNRWYDLSLQAMTGFAGIQTSFLQSGYLRYYIMTILAAVLALVLYPVFTSTGGWSDQVFSISMPEAYLHEWVIALLIPAAALYAAVSQSRLAVVASLGVVGYGVALIYILFGAPDLAMTQFCIETLTIILFVLVLYRLPRFTILSNRRTRIRDALVALANGGIMTALVLAAASEPAGDRISRFFAENALPLAHGRNVVNVILVDFRALDTLGEITVLALASLGVYVLLRTRNNREEK